jgi:septal ring factor EnvC (AmiA/AmiB activator)
LEERDEKIESRLAELKADFEKIEAEKKELSDKRNGFANQVSAIDRRIGEINVNQVALNARFQELIELLPAGKKKKYLDTPQKPKGTTASPKNEKEKKK